MFKLSIIIICLALAFGCDQSSVDPVVSYPSTTTGYFDSYASKNLTGTYKSMNQDDSQINHVLNGKITAIRPTFTFEGVEGTDPFRDIKFMGVEESNIVRFWGEWGIHVPIRGELRLDGSKIVFEFFTPGGDKYRGEMQ
jgi:hypothetical protein